MLARSFASLHFCNTAGLLHARRARAEGLRHLPSGNSHKRSIVEAYSNLRIGRVFLLSLLFIEYVDF